jgi:hypothetical protein
MMVHRLVVTLLAATLAVAASAQTYYKWTDAKGVTHYSAQRPSAAKAQPLHLLSNQPAPPAASTAAPPAASTASDLQAAKQDFAKQACVTARENLRLLSGSAMVLDTGTLQHPGDVTTATKLSTEQREAAKAEAHKQIDQYCDRG